MNHVLFKDLHDRGFFHQCTNEQGLAQAILQHKENNHPFAVYLGIDPTANSLHIGHTLPLYMLRHLQKMGLKIIILLGGGTAKIGDPSGKNHARQILNNHTITSNTQQIKKQCLNFFNNDKNITFIDNNTWLNNLNYIEFLRDIGQHFNINRMLSFDTYSSRIDNGLTFLEFNYQIFQSYDFFQLFNKEFCYLQIGGQDQWGNIVAGIDLIRKICTKEAFGLTCPLITTSNGKKMGKTEEGAIFLNSSLTSPSEFYQYWRNCDDRDVGKFLKLFTFLSLDECNALMTNQQFKDISKAKEILAFEVTKIIHGLEIATHMQEQSRMLFTRAEAPKTQHEKEKRIKQIMATVIGTDATKITNSHNKSGGITHGLLSQQILKESITLADLFVKAGLAKSKGEYRKKLVASKAAFCNEELIEEADKIITEDLFIDNALLLRAGKKRYYLFIIEYN